MVSLTKPFNPAPKPSDETVRVHYIHGIWNRLIDFDRADAVTQDRDLLDSLGNRAEFDDDGALQTRTANEANEIQSISGGWITPEYDAAGNMISGPKPGDETTRVHYIYDAWNRLTEVRADNSGTPGALIATYSYDGLNRRIAKEVVAGSVDTHYFYNTSWQCLEERVEVSGALPADADVQYVWGMKYVDDLILRDRDTDANGTMDERLYALSDANHNVTALVDAATGAIVERFLYDAYGTVTELDPDFTAYTGTDYDWEYTYTTRRLDEETGLMYYRRRMYDPGLGQFTTRDPIEADLNAYRYCGNNAVNEADPTGLAHWVKGKVTYRIEKALSTARTINPYHPDCNLPKHELDRLTVKARKAWAKKGREITYEINEECPPGMIEGKGTRTRWSRKTTTWRRVGLRLERTALGGWKVVVIANPNKDYRPGDGTSLIRADFTKSYDGTSGPCIVRDNCND